MHICVVNIPSRDRSIHIDSPGKSTLLNTCTSVRSVECCDCAILIKQEPMINSIRVNEDSKDASIWSKAAAIGPLLEAGTPAWKIECGDNALRIPQEAMNRRG